jgi:hypothetical protein
MASDKRVRFEPNDKRSIRLEPSGEAGMEAFRAQLTEAETAALAAMKESEPELCAAWNDAFLMRFVWARKLDVARAAELLKNHIQWRAEWGINDLDLESVRAYFQQGGALWSPGNYTKQGYGVSYIIAREFDPKAAARVGIRGLLHASYYTLDLTLDHDIEIARKGSVIVEDLSGASFMDLMRMMKGEADLDMRKMMDSIQNHLPSRMGGIIIVNAPWYVRLLTAIAKPMLKPKLRKKIHTCSVSELHQFFTPEQLPTMFGGQFNVNHEWLEPTLQARPHLSEGKYLDPSPKSEAFIESITGVHPVRSVSDIAAEAKSQRKGKKSKKSSKKSDSSDSE